MAKLRVCFLSTFFIAMALAAPGPHDRRHDRHYDIRSPETRYVRNDLRNDEYGPRRQPGYGQSLGGIRGPTGFAQSDFESNRGQNGFRQSGFRDTHGQNGFGQGGYDQGRIGQRGLGQGQTGFGQDGHGQRGYGLSSYGKGPERDSEGRGRRY